MTINEILKALEKVQTVSGNEAAVHSTIKSLLGDGFLFDRDSLNNLIATLPAKSEKSIMLCAHADQPGFICTHIEDSGLIRLASVGSLRLDTFVGSTVVFENGVKGILSCNKGLNDNDIKDSALFCDIGVKDKKAAEKKVHPGDRFAPDCKATKISANMISSYALSSKLACASLILAALKIKDMSRTRSVIFVFAAQNQAGCRGIGAVAHRINPDVAINIGISPCGDTPSASGTIKLSGGAVIKLVDKSSVCTKAMTDLLFDAAKSEKLSVQTEISDVTGSDTAAILKASGGIPTGEVSFPVRYPRTPSEAADLNDAEAVVRILCSSVKSYS